MKHYTLKEHQRITDEELEDVKKLNLEFPIEDKEVKYLKLNWKYEVSYYIGIDWLVEGDSAIMVLPKIENLDYLSMFLYCLECPDASPAIGSIYRIFFEKKPLSIESSPFEITPFIIMHFLHVVRRLVKKGLKKDYIRVEENLKSKIKGKLLFNQNLKMNTFKGRLDKNYCNYQEYSVDCLENRLLKSALLIVKSYVQKHYSDKPDLIQMVNYSLSAFRNVSNNIDRHQLKQVRVNPLYKDYAEALRIAKMILRNWGYSLKDSSYESNDKHPPFYIDMALLFECYVLSLLRKEYGKQIEYQFHGNYGYPDFLDIENKMVIDTKYKLQYSNRFDSDDIRQLSGYGRDKKVREKLSVNDDTLIDCVIIYPKKDAVDSFENRQLKENEIDQFEKFYKIGVKLPLKEY